MQGLNTAPFFNGTSPTLGLSDSLPSASLSLWLDRCPNASPVIVTCSLTGGASNSPGGPDVFFGLPQSTSLTVPLGCSTVSGTATPVALPASLISGAYFGSGPGAVILSCDVATPVAGAVADVGLVADLARNSLTVTVTPTLWPLLGDVVLPLLPFSRGVLRSFAFGSINATDALMAACVATVDASSNACASPASAAASPAALIAAAASLWGSSALPTGSTSFSVTLSGPTVLVLRARVPGAFASGPGGLGVTMGGVACAVLAASPDGLWAAFRSPNSSDILGGDNSYAALQLTNFANASSNSSVSRGAPLSCPPFCPGVGASVVPLAKDGLGLPSSFQAVTVSRPASGIGAPTYSAAVSSSSTLGFYYVSTCSLAGLFTDPATGACTNASDPSSALCAFGSGDSCSM